MAAGLALVGAVVAEFVAGSGGAQGLAWRILEASHRLQTAKMLAAAVRAGGHGADALRPDASLRANNPAAMARALARS